ncbi:unnamed protein product [Adineta steineri]|uniref:Uncharacterized protein n=1 Tax=Adineta steineri TaxID=433720 RepID=A0A814WTR9_9BILA|nr:unnamed protein product [Adineta steineri]CAF4042202.1 unnamed protein product [Adineta steineri]
MPIITVFELIESFHQTQQIYPCPSIFAVNWEALHRKYSTLATSFIQHIVEQRYKEIKLDQLPPTSSSSRKNNSTEFRMEKKKQLLNTINSEMGAPPSSIYEDDTDSETIRASNVNIR